MNIKIKKNIMFLLGILCISLVVLIYVTKKEGMNTDNTPTINMPTTDMSTTDMSTTDMPSSSPTSSSPINSNVKVVTFPPVSLDLTGAGRLDITGTGNQQKIDISDGLKILKNNVEVIERMNNNNIKIQETSNKQQINDHNNAIKARDATIKNYVKNLQSRDAKIKKCKKW